jgi:hypothetical protein
MLPRIRLMRVRRVPDASDDAEFVFELKHDGFRAVGLRDLRRRGIGQHTIEKALHKPVRIKTYTRIVAVIEESKKETCARARGTD